MFKTELETLLNISNTVDFVSVAVSITPEEYKKLSDFEKFALICDRSDDIVGSEVIKRFFDLISRFVKGNVVLSSLKSRRAQISAWRAIHGDVLVASDEIKDSENGCVDYYKFKDCKNEFDIIKYISEQRSSLSETLDCFLKYLDVSSVDAFVIDCDEFEYSRPDEYHAETVYQKILRGEKYKKSDIGLLVSHVICAVGKTKECRLSFCVKDSVESVRLLSELFEKRRADVEISVCVDFSACDTAVFKSIFDIMLKRGKKISSEIMIPEDANIKDVRERIACLLKAIPFSRIVWQKDYTAYIDQLRIG